MTLGRRVADGALLWQRRIATPPETVSLGDLAVDPANGRVVVASAAYANEGTTPGDLILRAYAANGRIAWTRTLPASDRYTPVPPILAISPTTGNVSLHVSGSGPTTPLLQTFTAAGEPVGSYVHEGPAPANPRDLVIDPGDDTVYLTGTTTGDPDPFADWITLAVSGADD